ncbi:TPA: GDP-mannose 4,6-dehydratase [Candidatus Woesearchaeota archaeon]|nr:GDP-mannose 4,6-dehydratase [Candidatus Woesearchaeota archaeon]
MNMTPTCLVTGIGGFVGSYLADFLHQQGWTVIGFDRSGKEIPNTITHKIDLLDKDNVYSLVQKINPQYIIHLAAQSSVKVSWDKPEETININVEGTRILLDAVIHAGIQNTCKLLVVSSAEIYGPPQQVPMNEDHSLNPINPYGQSRLQQEQLINEYIQKKNLQIIIARSFPHTGPGQLPTFACPSFAQQIVHIEQGKQESIINVGNLDAQRDFTDVRDVVKAYYLLLTKVNFGVFNVCSGHAVAMKDILQQLLHESTKAITIQQDPARMRPSDIPILVGSNTKIHQATGWKPIIPLSQTLRDILNSWRN